MQISGQIAGDTQSEVSVPILWIGHEEENGKNVDYGVMQYKSGGLFLTEMERLLRGKYGGAGKIPISVVCGITIRILISLRSLHSSLRSRDLSFSGHLHLDLHPGNIFLENASLEDPGGGFVKFIDFQNARQMNEHFRAKNDPPLTGYTPAFTAPEIERILMVPGTEREGLSQLKKSIRFSRESLYELLSLSYQMFIPAAFISWECLLAEEGKMKPETRGEKVKRGQTFLSRRSGSFGRIPEGMRLTGNGSGISTRDLRSSGSF